MPVGRLYWGLPLAPPGLLAATVGRLNMVVDWEGLTAEGLTAAVVVVGFTGVGDLDDMMDYDMRIRGRGRKESWWN